MNTHYRNNLEAVMQVNKNYTDTEIKKSEERILSIVARNNVDFIDHINEPTYRFTAPANSKLLMLQSIAGNSVKYSPSVASDTTSAYQKAIPSYSPSIDRASASMNILGGMSYKVNQLFSQNVNTTYNGIIVSRSDNYMLLNGTATATSYPLLSQSITFQQGHKYLYVVQTISGSKTGEVVINTYSVDHSSHNLPTYIVNATYQANNYGLYLTFPEGASADNWLVCCNVFDLTTDFGSGNEPTSVSDCATEYAKRGIDIYSYTPKMSAIRDTAITNVKSVGENILKLKNLNSTYLVDYTTNRDTNIFTLNGTPTGTGNITFLNENSDYKLGLIDGETYTIKFFVLGGTKGNGYGNCNYGSIEQAYDYKTTFTYLKSKPLILYWTISGTSNSYNNFTVGAMLVKGSTAPTEFKPYFSDTLAIDNNIQALAGYGIGFTSANSSVGTKYNYIDFNAKKFKVEVIEFTINAENIVSYEQEGVQNRYQAITDIYAPKNPYGTFGTTNIGIASNYLSVDHNNLNNLFDKTIAIYNTNFTINIRDDSITTLEGFKALCPIKVRYAIATTEETDISEYLDGNEIEIEPNGTLSFESTYSAYVPSNVSYNGVIKHSLATAVKQDGFNIWNEEYESGSYDFSTGLPTSSSSNIRSKSTSPIKVIPNITYYIRTNGSNVFFMMYDVNDNYLGFTEGYNRTLTFASNCDHIRFVISNAYGTTYNHDICINISNQALNGTYKPHKPTYTRALTNNEAKYSWGITTGVRNVRTYCDDEGNPVNEGQLDVGNQDLGELNWEYQSEYQRFRTVIDIKGYNNNETANVLINKYTVYSWNAFTASVDMAFSTYALSESVHYIYIRDTNYTDAPTFKTAINGYPLFYEKNATDTETLDDFDYFFDCEEGDTFTLVNTENLQCYATYSFLIKEAKSNE